MIKIRRVEINDLENLNAALNNVIKEKIYLASSDEISIENHKSFLERIVDNNLAQLVAIDGGEVVGWCEILPKPATEFPHVGNLGMGVVNGYRGQGIGKRLLTECVALAKNLHLEKVELEVFLDNITACEMYSNFGFVVEGVKKKARRLDGQYQDIQFMSFCLS